MEAILKKSNKKTDSYDIIFVNPQHCLIDCLLDLQQSLRAAVKQPKGAVRQHPPHPGPAPLQHQQQKQQLKLQNLQQRRDGHRRKRRRIPTIVSAIR